MPTHGQEMTKREPRYGQEMPRDPKISMGCLHMARKWPDRKEMAGRYQEDGQEMARGLPGDAKMAMRWPRDIKRWPEDANKWPRDARESPTHAR